MYVLGFSVLGTLPTVQSSGEDVVAFLTQSPTDVRLYAWTGAFVAIGLLIGGAYLAMIMPKPWSTMFYGGALCWVITTFVQAWLLAGLAVDPGGPDPTVVRLVFDIWVYWGPLINGATFTMALAVVALRFVPAPESSPGHRRIPAWLMWLALIFGVEQLLETVTVFGADGFLAPSGPMDLYVGGVLGIAWAIGLTVWGMRELDRRETAAA